MESAASNEVFSPEEQDHKRGRFPAINDGIYHGQGSAAPHRLANGHEEMTAKLRENVHINRMATFASGEHHTSWCV